MSTTGAAFYCVADKRYFLGAVALLNALRLHGHTEPVYICDCGMGPSQRTLLAGHAVIVEAPRDTAPWLSKTIAPLRHPAEITILIDADMIATRPLTPLLAMAADGVVAFVNDRPRHIEEWGRLLELPPPRRQAYVSSGLVALGGPTGRTVLELLHDRQGRVDMSRTLFGDDEPDYPFRYPEQDVLNAILAGGIPPAAQRALDNRLAPYPPFTGLRLRDLGRVECEYGDGERPYVLHHFGRKPWLEPIYHGLYSRLMTRLLLGDDLALPVPERMVPLRMRRGALARGARLRADVADVARRYILNRSEA